MDKEGASKRKLFMPKLKMFFPALQFGYSKCLGLAVITEQRKMTLPYVLHTLGSQKLRLPNDLLIFLKLTNGRPGMKLFLAVLGNLGIAEVKSLL